jgi:hypothetical protein
MFSAPTLAAGRNVLMALMGVATTLGVISAAQSQQLLDKLLAVGTAIGALMAAVSGLVMVATPIFAALSATMAHQKKAVSLQPHTMVVQTSTANDATKVAQIIATIPQVQQVIASPRVANETPSDKVVQADNAKPVATDPPAPLKAVS